MSFGFCSLNTPISISDAAIIQNFEYHRDVLIIARGSLIQFFSLEEGFKLRYEYKIFGDIARVIQLHHPHDSQSNILLILRDHRYSIIRFVNNALKTVQIGNLASTSGVPLDPPFPIAVSSLSLLLQLHQQVIQFFQITPNSQLGPPVNCSVPAKNIIDFDFLNTSDGARFAVLTEDFGQSTKLQVYDADSNSQIFTQRANNVITMPSDSYSLRVIDSNSLIVFSTSHAVKVTLTAVSPPKQKSSTIYTSHPLVQFARMDQSHFIAADEGNNLVSINIQDSDCINVMRIGSINVPIALLPYEGRRLISISQFGVSSSISLIGDINHLVAESKPLMINCSPVKKIIEVNSNEMIGICGNGYSHIIRQSLILDEFAQMPVSGITNVWFFNTFVVVSFSDRTVVISISENEVTTVKIDGLITEEQTIVFLQTSEASFVQITPTTVNINTITRNFGNIKRASVYADHIGLIFDNDNTFKIIDFDFNEISVIQAPASIEVIALNSQYVAVSSWPESTIFVYQIDNCELVRTIEKISCIDLVFTPDYLVVSETRDHCTYYLLRDENVVNTLHCDGMHYSIIPYNGNDVIIAGERPVLIQNLVVKGIEYNSFSGGSYSAKKFVLILNDALALCASKGFSMTVHEDHSKENIVDTIQICHQTKESEPVNSGPNFVVASRDNGNINLSVVEHPLSTLYPTLILKEIDTYIGMASITYTSKKFVAIIFGQHLKLYEVSEELLQERSNLDLGKSPFQISSYGTRFIVAFTDEFQLFEPDVVSHSDIRLKKITNMPTQGSTSCLSNDDECVAVCDELQSLVLYMFDENTNKFQENARNCIDFGLSICRVSIDDYFCVDDCGNFYQMQIGDTKNIESSDLDILSCCALGEAVTAMIVLHESKKETEENTTRVIVGTRSSQYIEVIKFELTEEFKGLYTEIEKDLHSLGRFDSISHRSVLIDNFFLQCPIMYNFDLIKLYLELGPTEKEMIAGNARLTYAAAQQICESILKLT